nr:hypothetical protein [Methanosarcina sp. MSH10X1]
MAPWSQASRHRGLLHWEHAEGKFLPRASYFTILIRESTGLHSPSWYKEQAISQLLQPVHREVSINNDLELVIITNFVP